MAECGEDQIDTNDNKNTDVEVSFSLVHRKDKIPFNLPRATTVGALKDLIFQKTQVPQQYQKLICGNITLENDDELLLNLKLHPINPKILLMGSIPTDIKKACDAVNGVKSNPSESSSVSMRNDDSNRKWFQQDQHKKVLEKNPKPEENSMTIETLLEGTTPESIMYNLINNPITGMLDKRGEKLRVTVKCDLGQLWLSTNDRTNKVSLSTIKAVESHPIENDETVSIMYIQLGPTEKSRFFIYYVPTKLCEPLKELLMQGTCLS